MSIRGLPAGGNVPNWRGRLENYAPKTRESNLTKINIEFNNENRADAINEIKADMAALKNSVSYLIALSTKRKSEPSNSGDPPRKRGHRDTFGESLSDHTKSPGLILLSSQLGAKHIPHLCSLLMKHEISYKKSWVVFPDQVHRNTKRSTAHYPLLNKI